MSIIAHMDSVLFRRQDAIKDTRVFHENDVISILKNRSIAEEEQHTCPSIIFVKVDS